jgi:hypothetical protein
VIQMFLFLLLGSALFFFLYALTRRTPPVEGSAEAVFKARQALTALQAGLLPQEMLQRIFTKSDYEYVMSAHDRHLSELFLEERRKIALSWVRQIRREILNLRQFHLRAVRFYARLSPRTELRLAFEFLALLCVCRALQIALYLRGPYAAPRMVGRAAAGAARVCDISEKAMSFLNPTQIDALAQKSARNLTAL